MGRTSEADRRIHIGMAAGGRTANGSGGRSLITSLTLPSTHYWSDKEW